jgi:hypothetical protein
MKKTFQLSILTLVVLMIMNQSAIAQKKVIAITSKVKIAAKPTEVFDVIRQLKRFPEWSPFLVTDPHQKYEITGTNGEIGSKYSWVGVDEKSKGNQTLAAMDGNKYVRMECLIEKPFEGKPVFEYFITENQNGVEVVQEFKLHLSGFSYFMTKLFGVKKKMIKTNQLGLDRLKGLVEKEALTVKK